jgi:hypothetical protein
VAALSPTRKSRSDFPSPTEAATAAATRKGVMRRCPNAIAHRDGRRTCRLAAMSAPEGVRMTGPHSFLTRPGYPDGILGRVGATVDPHPAGDLALVRVAPLPAPPGLVSNAAALSSRS